MFYTFTKRTLKSVLSAAYEIVSEIIRSTLPPYIDKNISLSIINQFIFLVKMWRVFFEVRTGLIINISKRTLLVIVKYLVISI